MATSSKVLISFFSFAIPAISFAQVPSEPLNRLPAVQPSQVHAATQDTSKNISNSTRDGIHGVTSQKSHDSMESAVGHLYAHH